MFHSACSYEIRVVTRFDIIHLIIILMSRLIFFYAIKTNYYQFNSEEEEKIESKEKPELQKS